MPMATVGVAMAMMGRASGVDADAGGELEGGLASAR